MINEPIGSTLIHNAHMQTESALLCLLYFAVIMRCVSLFVFISDKKISRRKVNNKTSSRREIAITNISQRKISNMNVSHRKQYFIIRVSDSAGGISSRRVNDMTFLFYLNLFIKKYFWMQFHFMLPFLWIWWTYYFWVKIHFNVFFFSLK